MNNKVGGTLTGVFLLLFACFFFATNGAAIGVFFLIAAIICFGIAFFSWYIPHSRDQAMIAEHRAAAEQAPAVQPVALIEERSRGVGQYFIPDEHPSSRNR